MARFSLYCTPGLVVGQEVFISVSSMDTVDQTGAVGGVISGAVRSVQPGVDGLELVTVEV